MTSQENIPLPPSKGELSLIIPPLRGQGVVAGVVKGRGMFLLFVIGSLRRNQRKISY